MKNIIIRIVVLFGVFVASVAAFMLILNRNEVISTRTMAEPTLPVIYMRQSNVTTNKMRGYTCEMDEISMRESLTLLPSDRNLVIEIHPYANDIKNITYEVSSLEDGSVVENGKIKTITGSADSQRAEFHIENPIKMGQEYTLRFTVDTGSGSPIYYYTRIVQRTGQNMEWYLEYADAFYQNCINNNMTDEMLSQLETESSSANSSIHRVTLKSDKDQVTWGNLSPVLVKKAVPTVLEINETTVSIKLDYIISAKDADNNEEFYTVSEYYRMRKAQEHVVLLDFERTATQFFNGSISALTQEGLNLGIRGKDVEYVVNDKGDIAAFVQAGELWLYDRSANKAVRIFSYSGNDHSDERTSDITYDISVSSVSDDGDTTFIVYGYRTAGVREGSVGISVYRYCAKENTTDEMVFIPLSEAFQMEEQGLSRLAFVNSKDQCFLYYDKDIYAVQIEDASVATLQADLDWQTVSVSASQMLVAWGNETSTDGYSTTIKELNLETGETVSIDAPSGDYIKTLGYMGEDIIYGLAHISDCYTDSTGNELFPMYRVSIYTPQGELKEDYMLENIYVTDVIFDDEVIILKRSVMEDGRLKQTSEDRLIHYAPEKSSKVDVKLKVTERQGTQVHLVFASRGESSNLLVLNTRYLPESDAESLIINDMVYDRDYYYVYAKGSLEALYKHINKAIEAADNSVGVVLNSKQQYVWERGNVSATRKLDLDRIPYGILLAPIEEEAVAEAVGEGYNVWNLSGCSLSSICYQISSGYPVAGKWSETENKLIVGYDQYNVWLFDAASGDMYAVAFEDAEAAFGACGNIFISYHN